MLDISRARERFGFEAHTGFREGLERTIEWYESVENGVSVREAA
jgi:nucleoside-diphosphate-sugar epimerase